MAAITANNVNGKLATSLDNVITTIVLQTGNGAQFPSLTAPQYFYATLANTVGVVEIVKVTARVVDTLTVVRGFDGTIAQAWVAGDSVQIRVVAALLNNKLDADLAAVSGPLTVTGAATFAAAVTASVFTGALVGNATTATTATALASTLAVVAGGTGATTATAALAALSGLSLAGGTLTGGLTAPTFTGALVGNAATATTATALASTLAIAAGGTGATTPTAALAALSGLPLTGGTLSGGLTAPTFTGALTGNATTATTATTATSATTASTATTAGNVTGTVAIVNGGTGSTTPAAALTALGIGSMATRNVTISTAAPSGGASGDIWFRY